MDGGGAAAPDAIGTGRLPGVPFAIRPLTEDDVPVVVALSLRAWAPVFASLEGELGRAVFGAIYPDWRADQAAAVAAVCRDPENRAWVAVDGAGPVGFAAVGFLDEGAARVGELHMIAVDPAHQRAGVGTALARHAVAHIEAQGADLAVIATGGDPGHAPARALYERLGFTPLPQVRYYRHL